MRKKLDTIIKRPKLDKKEKKEYIITDVETWGCFRFDLCERER